MKGSVVDKINGLAVMLYLNTIFDGFYATNQEAWMSVMHAAAEEQKTPPVKVDIVQVISLGDGEIDIASIQTFWRDEEKGTYNWIHRPEADLEPLKAIIKLDWKEAITE
jgi:hypothetical protein